MKLTSEKALDMLPAVVDIFEKIDIKTVIKESRNKYKVKDSKDLKEQEELFLDAFMDIVPQVLKKTKLVKEELFEIVAIAQDTSVDEVRKQSFAKTIKVFKDIFTDEDIMELFKSAI